jgi:DNA-binding transcriptional ArsR family regulator
VNRTQQDVRIISDLETLRLLTQPLRLRLLEEVRTAPAPITVKELAAALNTPQTKLYYHINLLEEAGFIRVASTRVVSGITEKRYEATSARIGVDRALLAGARSSDPAAAAAGNDALEALLAVLLDQVRSEIRRTVRAGLVDLDVDMTDQRIGTNRLVLGRKWLRLTPEEVERLEQGLDQLFAQFDSDAVPGAAPDPTSPDARPYELLLGFYPTVARQTDEPPPD